METYRAAVILRRGFADHHEEVAMPAGSTMTSCECPTSPLHQPGELSARPKQKPRREAGLSCCSLTSRKGLAASVEPSREPHDGNGLSIGGKPPRKRRAEPLVSMSGGRHPRSYFMRGGGSRSLAAASK